MPSFALVPLDPFPPPAGPFPSGTQFQDEQVNVGPPEPKYVSFNGPGVQATYDSINGRVNVEVSSGAIEVRDEGVVVLPAVRKINFVGAGVTATAPSGVTDLVNVSIPGGGGGGGTIPLYRARRFSNQTSDTVVTFTSLQIFNSGYGTFDNSTGLFTVTTGGVFCFTAGLTLMIAAGVPGGAFGILMWPTWMGATPDFSNDTKPLVVHQLRDSAFSSSREIAACITTGPVQVDANWHVGIAAVSLSSGLCAQESFSTSNFYLVSSLNFESAVFPAFFSAERYT